jgi:hypothetical protein
MVEVDARDAPLLTVPHRDAVCAYLMEAGAR